MVEEPANGNGFTQKEMLVRLDGKLDIIAGKQQHYDVELALLRARQDETEKDVKTLKEDNDNWQNEVRSRIEGLSAEQGTIGSRQKATAYIVAAVVIVTNIVAPIILRHL